MHFSIIPAVLFVSAAAAQSFSYTSSTSTACAAQPVLEACLASTQAIVASCGSTDYSCLCQKWTDVQTCFLQCPNDPRSAATISSRTTYCNNASIYTTTTSSAISRAVSSAYSAPVSAATTASGSSGAVKVASSTTSGAVAASASASTTAKSGAAANVVNGGLVGLVGVVAALL